MNRLTKTALTTALVSGLMLSFGATAESELTGKVVGQSRFFSHSGADPRQADNQLSLALEAVWYSSWNDDMDSVVFKPFFRFDSEDDERQHGDIRELFWLHVGDGWELRTGINKVYWGVTESQHLVDVINQTDRIESVDGEQKLGQPMVHLSLLKDWGTIDAFVLPGFREPRFASAEGRFRPPLPIADHDSQFESSAGNGHVDFALRWSHTIEDWDVGLSYFDGTNRDADFIPTVIPQDGVSQLVLTPYYAQMQQFGVDVQATIESWLWKFDGTNRDADFIPTVIPQDGVSQLVLTPYYAQMQQFGVDVQATIESWLWKFEAIYRDTDVESFTSVTAGFEYTIVGIFDSVWDLGLLTEYQFDQRDDLIIVPGQNDLFFGSRIAFNDEDGSELLIGVVQDLDDSGSRSGLLEASSRINDNWKWRVDAWFFQTDEANDISYSLRRDDFVQLSLEYYF